MNGTKWAHVVDELKKKGMQTRMLTLKIKNGNLRRLDAIMQTIQK
jgi:hypothetical protein